MRNSTIPPVMRLALILTCLGLAGCTTPVQAEDAYRLGVSALEKNDRDTAKGYFAQATASDPSLLEAHLNLAAIDLAEARPREARARLEPLLSADRTQDPRLRYLHALALLDVGEEEAAMEALRALDAEDFPEAAFLLGQQAYLAGDEGEAENYFKRYLAERPSGGFGAEATAQLVALADQLADELEATADATLAGGSDAPEGDAVAVEPAAVEPEPSAQEADPVVSLEKPRIQPKPAPQAKPQPADALSPEEKAWRDARFLEIVKHNYAGAITAYRRYLSLAPLGERATGAQEGIVRCEKAIASGTAVDESEGDS